MMIEEEDILLVYHDKQLYRFRKSLKHEFSYFGGPIESYPLGVEHGLRPVHHVATLWGQHLPFLLDERLVEIPLFYGFCYDNCHLRYCLDGGDHDIDLLELIPSKSADNYPYIDYPPMLPYYPLAPVGPETVTLDQFQSLLRQPAEIRDGETVVVVPSQFTLGMSLWGKTGDAENTQIIYHIDPKTQTIEGYRCNALLSSTDSAGAQ